MTRFAILPVLLFAASAFAQPALPSPPPPPGARDAKVMVFDPERVLGATERPDGTTVHVPVRRRAPSLIRVRADFQRELLQSAELL